MSEIAVTPVLDLPTLVQQAKLIGSYREAVAQVKQGNIYIEVMPDDPARAYWVRLDRPKLEIVAITGRTRLRWVDDGGTEHVAVVVPRPGRARDA